MKGPCVNKNDYKKCTNIRPDNTFLNYYPVDSYTIVERPVL